MLITKSIIKAAIPCAAKNDIRYYLNGALFEWTNSDKRLRVISTNGLVLSAFSVEVPFCEDPDFSIIVPLEVLIYVSKIKSPAEELKPNGDGWQFADKLFTPIDGKFPDYRSVIPNFKGRVSSPANFDPDLLVLARKALAAHYDKKAVFVFPLEQYGYDGAAMHNGQNDAMVVIMPARLTERDEPALEYRGFV